MLHVDHIFSNIHKQHDLVFHNIKKILFVCWCCLSSSMMGLNCVLSICMGLSFGKIVKMWGGIISAKLHYIVGAGSQHLSCQCSKNLLSYRTTCIMAWLKVRGLAWWTLNPSCCYVIQIKSNLWMLFYPMKCHKPII